MGLFSRRDEEKEDGGRDTVGKNPTGRPRKSSAGKRRQHDQKLFGGTEWDRKNS
jgi:hypothetical protein